MSDKIVTHGDLPTLQMMRNCTGDGAESAVLLDRLIAAAEADAPPLPEGWTVRTYESDHQRVFWCDKAGNMRDGDDPAADIYYTPADVARLPGGFTPLRPTITEADVVKAAVVLMDRIPAQTYEDITRDMFRAAGVEVSKP